MVRIVHRGGAQAGQDIVLLAERAVPVLDAAAERVSLQPLRGTSRREIRGARKRVTADPPPVNPLVKSVASDFGVSFPRPEPIGAVPAPFCAFENPSRSSHHRAPARVPRPACCGTARRFDKTKPN